MIRNSCLAAAMAAALAFGPDCATAAQRVFVKSTGSDANTASGCLFANPCRSFAAAMTVVDPNGEVVAVDAAGYGPVTIDKSVTILANPGVFAGSASSSGNAVTIPTPGVHVVLRGLSLKGLGANFGVLMTSGSSLTVENCVFSGFAISGIAVSAVAAVRITDTVLRGNGEDGVFIGSGAKASLANVSMSGNGRAGLVVHDETNGATTVATVSRSDASLNLFGVVSWSSTAAGSARASVMHSTIANNAEYGFYVVHTGGGTNATGVIGGSQVTGNDAGLANGGAGLASQGNNHVQGNGTATGGTITNVGSM